MSDLMTDAQQHQLAGYLNGMRQGMDNGERYMCKQIRAWLQAHRDRLAAPRDTGDGNEAVRVELMDQLITDFDVTWNTGGDT